MAEPINGPRLDAKSGQAKQLVVFLHGYGADGKDLIEIGRQWRPWLPDAAFVAPNAPEPCAMSPMGRQWFALSNRRPDEREGADERWAGVVKARPALDAFLDAELARLGLDESRLALVGFSQGTMMALHVGLRRKRAPASIVGYSGVLIGAEHLGEAAARDARGAPPADPARAWRSGSGHSARSACSSRRKNSPRPIFPTNGICRSASATASTLAACATAACSSPKASG